jgi:hypothetical protein
MTISIGTKIKSANMVWTVVSCGGGFYGIRAEGSRRVLTIPCGEAQADIDAGRAVIV